MPIRIINDSPQPIRFQLQYFKGLPKKVDVETGFLAGPFPSIAPRVTVEVTQIDYKPGPWMTLRATNGIGKVSQRFGVLHRGQTTVTIRNDQTGKELALPSGVGWIRIRPEEGGIQQVWTKSFYPWRWSRALQLDSPRG
ncbi:hypothetical protein H9L39_19177 [Fusarium oxysporum f. sp. albedinis]|nr:hypothetical protein H9L39_19177 [Fusarium oxysporum f. sp. albedinis]